MAEVVVEPGSTVEVDFPGFDVEVATPGFEFEVVTPAWNFEVVPAETQVDVSTPATDVDVLLLPGPQGPQGQQGPEGPAYDGGGAYTHTQEAPSTVWDIDHGLGFNPAGIRVIDVAGDTWFPLNVTHPTPGQVTRLTFLESVAGTADVS